MTNQPMTLGASRHLPRQRPGFLTLLSLQASLAGAFYVASGIAFSVGLEELPLTSPQKSLPLYVLAYGLVRLAAGYGLFTLRSYGRILQQMSSVLLLVAIVAAAVRWPAQAFTIILLALVPAFLAVASLVYLSRPQAGALFEAETFGEVREPASSPGAIALLAGDVAMIAVLTGFQMFLVGSLKQNAAPVVAEPKNDAEAFEVATALYRDGNHAAAIPLFQRVIAGDPKHALAHARLGLSYCETGQFEKAIPILERAMALDPADWHSPGNLALTYLRMGKPALGLPHIEYALTLNPEQPNLLLNKGLLLTGLGRAREAIAPLEKAAQLAPKDPAIHYNLALAYHTSGRPDLARREQQLLAPLDSSLSAQLSEQLK